ncbi:adhesion G-protein coupled receptor G2-like isoform X7 [Lineus longissimus]|uniref:adhesion G-protein coupled receptor G2-like isoform X7 n=1 Tax=Lineus longissimus TaxID=88925 RepID=UPI00315D0410
MMLRRTALLSLYGIFNFVGLLQARTACSSNKPICDCRPEGASRQRYKFVNCNMRTPPLTTFPGGIPNEVVELDLSHNEIEHIPQKKSVLKNLRKLKKLQLSTNRITSINDGDFTDLKELINLDLSSNPITTITAKAFTGLRHLSVIDLRGVTLNCGCVERDFYKWAATYKPTPISILGIRCSNLESLQFLSSVPFDSPIYSACEPPPPATRCMSCSKTSAFNDDECDAKGFVINCSAGQIACKMEFEFTKKGHWALQKLCSESDCTSQQPAPCVDPKDGFYDQQGSCTMCCGGDLCNEGYEEIKDYLKNIVFKIKLNLKDAKTANSTEIQAAIVNVVNAANLPGVIQPPTFKIEGSEGYVEVNATFLRGYMDTILNSLKPAIELGFATDPVLKEEIGPGKIEIWTTEYCLPEQTFDELKGNYSWPTTKSGATSMVECQRQGNEGMSTRRCVFGPSPSGDELIPVWGDPDLRHCAYISKTTEALNTLTKLPITNGTVNAVSKQLATVSASAENVADVSMSTEVIDNIVNSEAAFYKENVNSTTKNVVGCISNLLDVDFNTMQRAGSARRLVANIEAMIKKISLKPGQEMDVVDNNLALTLVDTTTGKADGGLQYGVTAKPGYPEFNDTNVGVGKRGATVKTSVTIPPGVFKDKAIKKAAFVGYKSDMLFKLMELDSSTLVVGDSKKFNTTSNSMVLAAILDRPVSGLTGSDLIDMKFEHREKKLADNPRCTWWDQASNGGKGTWSTKGCTVGATEAGVTTCKCDHLTNFALLMDVYGSNSDMSASHQQALTIISITGCTLSAVALIFTIFTYVYFHRKLLKDNPSKILLNLCAALLGLNIVFLGGTHYQVDDGACKAVAVLLHYFLLAGFTWMGVEAFYMYLALVRVFRPYFSKLILKCCLVGWGLPLVIVSITIGVNKTDNYYLKGGQICWIRDIPFYGAIVAPVCAILIVNIIAFIMVIRQLHRLTERKKLTKMDKAHTSTMTQLRGAVSVLVLLGLTWLFAFLSIGDASLAFAYIFAILNTLQGLWVFVFYCLLKKDVQHAWMRKLICCPTPEDSRSSKGKYTLNHQNTTKKLTGSEGSCKQSDSTGVTLATYKRVSTV